MPVSRFALRLLSCASCACGLLAAQPLATHGDLLCELDGGCRPDAALGLLQLATQPQATRPQTSYYTRFLQLNHTGPSASNEDNCKKFPTLCGEPFNCFSDQLGEPNKTSMLQALSSPVATADGHANMRSWCTATVYDQTIAKYCIASPDLVKNAHLVFDQQVAMGAGQADASYCFLEGHCVNPNVSADTTLAEAEVVCDAKYGHEEWTTLSLAKMPFELSMVLAPLTGFRDRKISSFYGKLACAMGNFHCDVMYCKETYCKMPEYRSKYEHFLKDYGYPAEPKKQ